MGAKELIAGFVTNAGATLTTLTASGSSDSFTVKNAPFQAGIWLEDVIADAATAGELRILSPRLHDQVNGIRLNMVATLARELVGPDFRQYLYPQDAITVQATSGAADSTAVVLGIYYEDLPGINARMATWQEVMPQIEDYMGVRNGFTTSATIGTWGGEAINADFDQFIANRDYAIIGYNTDVRVTAVAYVGPETGNIRTGGPGEPDRITTRQYFLDQDRAKLGPRIPLINSANRGGTNVQAVDNAASTAMIVDTLYALLKER